MKIPPFTYHRPETLDDALSLLAQYGDDAKVLAGGQSLIPVMALRLGRPDHVVDIGRVAGLTALRAGPDGTTIGALVRHADAERSADVARHAPLVAAAAPHIGHRAIRTRGTLVGSVAHADPAAEMPAVCLALDATMVAVSNEGIREIAAADFFQGYLTTALAPNEVLTEIRLPPWPAGAGGTVVEVSRRHGDYALVGVACHLEVASGMIRRAALAFFGVDGTPVRVSAAEDALVGRAPDDAAFMTAAEVVGSHLDPPSDVHGTANYRRHLAGVLTRRGLADAARTIGAAA